MTKKLFFFLFLLVSVFSQEEEILKRIRLHMVIGDYLAAKKEAKDALEIYQDSQKVYEAYIKALAKSCQDDKECVQLLKQYTTKFAEKDIHRSLYEEIAWQILDKGMFSEQLQIRLTSLIGAYLTRDAHAVKYILTMMDDSNAILRTLAIKMACDFQDAPLKTKIKERLQQEKLWFVRLEILKAVGIMRMKDQEAFIKKYLLSDRSTLEEKAFALEALVNMYEDIKDEELLTFFQSPRSHLRSLACEVATHLEKIKMKKEILDLCNDKNVDVKLAALRAFHIYLAPLCTQEEKEKYIQPLLDDLHPLVAITAAWVYIPFNEKLACDKLQLWLQHSFAKYRRYAVCALAHSNKQIMENFLPQICQMEDPYIKVNFAIGLIGQKIQTQKAKDMIYDFLQKEKHTQLMIEEKRETFSIISPSQAYHLDHIPSYPEAIDAMTRLKLISHLAMMEDGRVKDLLKDFLKSRRWGITGMAAALLMQEGNQEAFDILKDLLQEEDVLIKIQAALVLALYGKDPSAMPVLQQAYYQADHERKMQILQVMGFVANEKSYTFFMDVLEEPFQMLRVIDASSFIQTLYR